MAMPSSACAEGGSLITSADTNAGASTAARSGLQERMEAAIRKERAASKGARFWTVYKFKLRNGIGLDTDLPRNLKGNTFVHGLRLQRRSSAPSHNAGVYLLHNLSDESIEKVELHDLDRYREQSGLPVHMLGDSETGESLELLRHLLEKRPGGLVGERLVLALALHDDPQVESILKNIIDGSYEEKEKAQAALWLGDLPGQSAYLESVARNERIPDEARKQAVIGIGYSRAPGALSILRKLYKSNTVSREVREQSLFAASLCEDKKGAAAFLNEVLTSDPDAGFRQQASLWLKQISEHDM